MNDHGLASIVALVERDTIGGVSVSFTVPVTLTVSGAIIYGTIVRSSEFTDWLINTFTSNMRISVRRVATPQTTPDVATRLLLEALSDPSVLDSLTTAPDEPPRSAATLQSSSGDSLDADADRLLIIHLRDATIWIGGGTTPVTVPYWRGRLDLISGWALGNRRNANTL